MTAILWYALTAEFESAYHRINNSQAHKNIGAVGQKCRVANCQMEIPRLCNYFQAKNLFYERKR